MNAEGRMMKAAYWHSGEGGTVVCELCPHGCVIAPGKCGMCGVRENQAGTLVSLNYCVASSCGMDPIEKKPLYHFFPGSKLLSIGTYGCNFSCKCCQNYQIAKEFSAAQLGRPNITAAALLAELPAQPAPGKLQACCGMAYTYNEPSVWFETVREVAQAVRARGLKNVLVTNGYICAAPLAELLEWVDALNIDLKAFSEQVYQTHCGGHLAPVLAGIEMAAARAHVELTILLIPGLNDDAAQLRAMRDWICGQCGPRTPVHLSRYVPMHRMTAPATPAATLARAHALMREKLAYVYVGNTGEEQDTHCADCGTLVIQRRGYHTRAVGLRPDGACTTCGARVAIAR
jgi:pyruvate formate lyase activating enzyme